MNNLLSKNDEEFKSQIENLEYPVSEFDHRAHLRLAYIYLVQEENTEVAVNRMRESLKKLLIHAGVDPAVKFHETLTEAWILAVNHFINSTDSSSSSDDFIDQNQICLTLILCFLIIQQICYFLIKLKFHMLSQIKSQSQNTKIKPNKRVHGIPRYARSP